jgi:hypothetical protein
MRTNGVTVPHTVPLPAFEGPVSRIFLRRPASFTDVSCAGATTGSMTGLQGLAAPQFNALGVQETGW